MTSFFANFLFYVSLFYIAYLVVFSTFSFFAVLVGAHKLNKNARMKKYNKLAIQNNEPISILIPAYNEAVTIVKSVKSLLALDYAKYEIIVIDDGSKDETAQTLIDEFGLFPVSRPINNELFCKSAKAVYEIVISGTMLTLISKENGGKGDALNMGINAARHDYFICMDADSMLERDALQEIAEPLYEDNRIVAVGGMILLSQCVRVEGGKAVSYKLPANLLVCMQAVEYNRSFLASRIFMDAFNGNLIISGAFGLFKKSMIIAAGGYSTNNLGEDMELCMKLHGYCRNNNIDYRIAYQPSAVCLTQAPSRLRDLVGQRRRWHIGLLQSLLAHRRVMFNLKFGWVSFFSYLYYLLYELLSPIIEVFGLITIGLALYFDVLNITYMLVFLGVYAIYGTITSLCAFSQYAQRFRIRLWDMVKALILCVIEFGFFRNLLVVVRMLAFVRYGRNKKAGGEIRREQ